MRVSTEHHPGDGLETADNGTTSNGEEGASRVARLGWIHAVFADYFAADFLLAQGSIDSLYGTSQFLDWVEPLALASQMCPPFAERAINLLLQTGGTAAGSAAARLAAGAHISEVTLHRALAAAVGIGGPKPWLSDSRTGDQYRENVCALAPRFGPRILPHLVAEREPIEIGIVGRWWPNEACAAFSELMRRCDSPYYGYARQKAVRELGALGERGPRNAQAALSVLRTVKSSEYPLPISLRRLHPIPETVYAVAELGVPRDPRMAWVLLSTLANVGAQYPQAVTDAALGPLWSAVTRLQNWEVMAHGAFSRVALALKATEEVEERATLARAVGELVAYDGSRLEDLLERWRTLPTPEGETGWDVWNQRYREQDDARLVLPDESGSIPRDFFIALSRIRRTPTGTAPADVAEFVWSASNEERLAGILSTFVANQTFPLEAWRSWLFQVLREATTRWSSTCADLDLVKALQETESAGPGSSETTWAVFSKPFPPRVGDGWLEIAGEEIAAKIYIDDDRANYAAHQALNQLVVSHPWATLNMLLETRPRDEAHQIWWCDMLMRACERSVLECPRGELRNQVASRVESIARDLDPRVRDASFPAVRALGTRDWRLTLPLLQELERDQRNADHFRQQARDAKRELLVFYGNSISGDPDIDLIRGLNFDGGEYFIHQRWNTLTLLNARVQAALLWPARHIWRPPVSRWSEPWRTSARLACHIPQALTIVVLWGLPLLALLLMAWVFIYSWLITLFLGERLGNAIALQFDRAKRRRWHSLRR